MWDKGYTDTTDDLLHAVRWYNAAVEHSAQNVPNMTQGLTAKRNAFALAHTLKTRGKECTPETYACETVN